MPLYTFEDENGEYIDVLCSISEMETFQKENPNMKRVISRVTIGDPSKVGSHTKPADSFREVLREIKHKNYGSNINTF